MERYRKYERCIGVKIPIMERMRYFMKRYHDKRNRPSSVYWRDPGQRQRMFGTHGAMGGTIWLFWSCMGVVAIMMAVYWVWQEVIG